MHRVIRTSVWQWFRLLCCFNRLLMCLCCRIKYEECTCGDDDEDETCRSCKLGWLYMEGQDKLKQDFDILDLIRKVRYLNVVANSTFLKD